MTVRCLALSLSLTAALVGSLAEEQVPSQQDFTQLSQQAAQAQREGREEQAIRLYLKALQIKPEWPDGWRNVGMLLADRREFVRAEAAFRNLLDIEPKNGAGWALLGLTEYELGQLDKAYEHIQHGRTLGLGNQDLENVAAYHAALIMILKGEFEIAQRILVRVARSGADDPDLVTALGEAALRLVMKPEKLGPQEKSLVTRVGQIEFQATHSTVPEVVAAYQKLLAEEPRNPALHYAFGSFLVTARRYDQALEEMQKVLQLDPRHVMALLQIAMTYVRTQPERALPYAQEAVRLAPGLFVAHYALGWTFFKLGQDDRAIHELEGVVRLAPNSPQAHYALSEAYTRARRKADSDRERQIFKRLKQTAAPASGSPASPENSAASPDALPSHPEP